MVLRANRLIQVRKSDAYAQSFSIGLATVETSGQDGVHKHPTIGVELHNAKGF